MYPDGVLSCDYRNNNGAVSSAALKYQSQHSNYGINPVKKKKKKSSRTLWFSYSKCQCGMHDMHGMVCKVFLKGTQCIHVNDRQDKTRLLVTTSVGNP